MYYMPRQLRFEVSSHRCLRLTVHLLEMAAVVIVSVAIIMSTVEHGKSLRGEVDHLEDALQSSRDTAIAAIVIMSVALFIKIGLLCS